MEEMLREKEVLCDQLKGRLRALHADQDNTDSAISSLEDSLTEKDKLIERSASNRNYKYCYLRYKVVLICYLPNQHIINKVDNFISFVIW